MKIRFAAALLCLALTSSTMVSRAQQAPAPDALSAIANGLTFRNIGPFRTAA